MCRRHASARRSLAEAKLTLQPSRIDPDGVRRRLPLRVSTGRYCCRSLAHVDPLGEGLDSQLAEFGLNVTSFFKTLKLLAVLFLLLSLFVAAPLLGLMAGTSLAEGSSISAASLTLGGLKVDRAPFPAFGALWVAADVLGVCMVLAAYVVLKAHEVREAKRVARHQHSIEMFAVFVERVPEGATEVTLRRHMEGVVEWLFTRRSELSELPRALEPRACIHEVRLLPDEGRLLIATARQRGIVLAQEAIDARIQRLRERMAHPGTGSCCRSASEHVAQLRLQVARLSQERRVLEEKALDVTMAIHDDDLKHDKPMLCAFVTFERPEVALAVASEYGESWLAYTLQPKALRLDGTTRLRVSQAPPPSSVIWENLGVSRRSRSCRQVVTALCALLAVLAAGILFVGLASLRSTYNLSACEAWVNSSAWVAAPASIRAVSLVSAAPVAMAASLSSAPASDASVSSVARRRRLQASPTSLVASRSASKSAAATTSVTATASSSPATASVTAAASESTRETATATASAAVTVSRSLSGTATATTSATATVSGSTSASASAAPTPSCTPSYNASIALRDYAAQQLLRDGSLDGTIITNATQFSELMAALIIHGAAIPDARWDCFCASVQAPRYSFLSLDGISAEQPDFFYARGRGCYKRGACAEVLERDPTIVAMSGVGTNARSVCARWWGELVERERWSPPRQALQLFFPWIISAAVVSLAVVLSVVMTLLSGFESHWFTNERNASLAMRLLVAKVLVLAVVPVYAASPAIRVTVRMLRATGVPLPDLPVFSEFSGPWYAFVGVSFVTSCLTQAVTPHVKTVLVYLRAQLRNGLFALLISVDDLEDATLAELQRATHLPRGDYRDKLATYVGVTALAYVFASGIPLLYVCGAATLCVAYVLEKVLFLRVYRCPDAEDNRMVARVTAVIPLIAAAHCAVGAWMYSSASLALGDGAEALLRLPELRRQFDALQLRARLCGGDACTDAAAFALDISNRLTRPLSVPLVAMLALIIAGYTLARLWWLLRRAAIAVVRFLCCVKGRALITRLGRLDRLAEVPAFSVLLRTGALSGPPSYSLLAVPRVQKKLGIDGAVAARHATLTSYLRKLAGRAVTGATAQTWRTVVAHLWRTLAACP